jgi:UDP-glucose 4-epimerase
MPMNVLITGIQSQLAQLVAGALAVQPDIRVIGADRSIAGLADRGVELVTSSLRGEPLAELLRSYTPDVLIHLDQPDDDTTGPGQAARAGQLQTIELVATAAAHRVGRVLLRSSTLVYGARPDQPALLPEETPLPAEPATGLRGDYLAIERFARAFADKKPAMRLTTLRCAALLGPHVASPLQRYLAEERPPVLLGFNPRIQGVHINDAALAFALATIVGSAGIFNIAAEPILLSQAIRLAGHTPLPLPALAFSRSALASSLRLTRAASLPFDPDFLRYACVADTRHARAALGWEPHYTTASAITTQAEVA